MSLLSPRSEESGPEVRVAGVPVRIEWTFVILMALFGLPLGEANLIVAWLVIVTVSVLVHEFGHAVALRSWGVRSRIVLYGMGGVTIPAGRTPTRWSRIAVSLAGPATGMVLLGIPALLLDRSWPAPDPWDDVLVLVVWVNIGYGVLNLLPILPLDGGNVAHELLDAATRGKGEVPARWLSMAVAVAGGVFAFTQGYVFAALFAGFLVADNYRALDAGKARGDAGEVQAAAAALEQGDPGRALQLTDEVLAHAKDPRVRALAGEVGAWAALSTGDRAGAARLLAAQPAGIEPSGHLRALLTETVPAEQVNATVDAWLDRRYVPARTYVDLLAEAGLVDTVVDRLLASRADGAEAARMGMQHALFLGGRFDEAARLGEAMVRNGTREPIVAYNTACAHARAGRVDAALSALGVAADLGFTDVGLLERDPDLATVRADPRFAMLRRRIPG